MSDEFLEAQNMNLASALAFGAIHLQQKEGDESDLYNEIVMIPHYHQKRLALLDKEDESGVVNDNFEGFQKLYHPIIKEHFSEIMEIDGNRFRIDDSMAAQKKLSMHLNDNVFRNLDKFSVLSFDKELRFHKKEFTHEQKTVIVDKFL